MHFHFYILYIVYYIYITTYINIRVLLCPAMEISTLARLCCFTILHITFIKEIAAIFLNSFFFVNVSPCLNRFLHPFFFLGSVAIKVTGKQHLCNLSQNAIHINFVHTIRIYLVI